MPNEGRHGDAEADRGVDRRDHLLDGDDEHKIHKERTPGRRYGAEPFAMASKHSRNSRPLSKMSLQ